MSDQATAQKIEQLNKLLSDIRNWRIVTAVASLAIITMFLYVLHDSASRLFNEGPAHDEFVSELGIGLTRDVGPQVVSITTQTLRELAPRVKAEVLQLQLRTPEIANSLQTELQLFQVNVPARAEKVLHNTIGKMIKEREATIRSLYADISPEKTDRAVNVLVAEGQRRAGNITAIVVAPYEETLQKIVADLSTIRETEAVTSSGKTASEDLTALLNRLLEQELAAVRPAVVAAAEKAIQVTEAK